MFREMDEIFARLLSRWEDDFPPVGRDVRDYGHPGREQEFAGAGEEPGLPPAAGAGQDGPVPEIVCHDGGVTVAVELPGVTGENLNLAVRGGTLLIEGVSEDRVYSARAALPPGTDPASLRHSLKNGVLEVTFGRA